MRVFGRLFGRLFAKLRSYTLFSHGDTLFPNNFQFNILDILVTTDWTRKQIAKLEPRTSHCRRYPEIKLGRENPRNRVCGLEPQ